MGQQVFPALQERRGKIPLSPALLVLLAPQVQQVWVLMGLLALRVNGESTGQQVHLGQQAQQAQRDLQG